VRGRLAGLLGRRVASTREIHMPISGFIGISFIFNTKTPAPVGRTNWLLLAPRLHYLSASRQDERKNKGKEKPNESKDEHQGRQRVVGQLVWKFHRYRTEFSERAKKKIPGKEKSNESEDEHKGRQRTVGQLILRVLLNQFSRETRSKGNKNPRRRSYSDEN